MHVYVCVSSECKYVYVRFPQIDKTWPIYVLFVLVLIRTISIIGAYIRAFYSIPGGALIKLAGCLPYYLCLLHNKPLALHLQR